MQFDGTITIIVIINLAMMVFAVGAFVNEAKSTKKLVTQQADALAKMDIRIGAVEVQQIRQSAIMDRTAATLDKVDGRLDLHVTTSKCGEHDARIRELNAKLDAYEAEVKRLRDRVDALSEQRQ